MRKRMWMLRCGCGDADGEMQMQKCRNADMWMWLCRYAGMRIRRCWKCISAYPHPHCCIHMRIRISTCAPSHLRTCGDEMRRCEYGDADVESRMRRVGCGCGDAKMRRCGDVDGEMRMRRYAEMPILRFGDAKMQKMRMKTCGCGDADTEASAPPHPHPHLCMRTSASPHPHLCISGICGCRCGCGDAELRKCGGAEKRRSGYGDAELSIRRCVDADMRLPTCGFGESAVKS